MTLLDHALRYAELGLRVFPLWWYGRPDAADPEREPRVVGTPMIGRWPDRASSDERQIRRWWEQNPEAGIGLATGDRLDDGTFLFVVDLDRHDPAHDGIELFDDLEAAHSTVGDGPTALTGGGGVHRFLRSATQRTNARGNLPRGIDVRGAGGFVVLPPSSHKSGSRYEWEIDFELGSFPIPAAPEWLERILDGELDENGNVPEVEQAPKPEPKSTKPTRIEGATVVDTRPGTEWAERTSWEELLLRDGWTHARRASEGHDEWTRPGKTVREGISATTGYAGSDSLVVHSDAANVPPGNYSKLGYLAAAHFDGDHSAAARSIAPERPSGGFEKLVAAHRSSSEPPSFPEPENGEEWPLPEPLDARRGAPPSFPAWIFPAWIREQIDQAATEMQVGPDLPAMLALGALATIAGGRVEVVVENAYREPTNLYLVVALPPGAGKSPVFRMMIEKPLGAWERDLDEGTKRDRAIRSSIRKSKEKSLDKAIQSGNEEEIRKAHVELDEYEEPVRPKLFVDDVTVEKLAIVLGEQRGRLALVSSEGGLFDQMTGRYSEKSTLDPYLQAWNGDTIRVDRVGRDELVVYDPALTIALTVQPSVIEKLAEKPELRGRGLTSRFMFAYPSDRVGTRSFSKPSSYSLDVEATYHDRLLDLARILRGSDEEGRRTLRLTSTGSELIRRKKDELEPRQARHSGDLADMREWITKAISSTIRVAGLLSLVEERDRNDRVDRVTGELLEADEISTEYVDRALVLLDYWIAHARRVHDLFSEEGEVSIASRLLDWISARVEPGGEFTLRDVTQWSRTGEFSKKSSVVEPLGLLVELGYVRPDDPELVIGSAGRGKTESYRLTARLMEAQLREEGHDPSTTSDRELTEGAKGEPMSLMSQEVQESSISTSPGTDTREDEEEPSHEAHEAQLREEDPEEGHDRGAGLV